MAGRKRKGMYIKDAQRGMELIENPKRLGRKIRNTNIKT